MGSCDFGAELDMWSLGCVAAELFLLEPLFQIDHVSEDHCFISFLDEHVHFLGALPTDSLTHEWSRQLPWHAKWMEKCRAKRKSSKGP